MLSGETAWENGDINGKSREMDGRSDLRMQRPSHSRLDHEKEGRQETDQRAASEQSGPALMSCHLAEIQCRATGHASGAPLSRLISPYLAVSRRYLYARTPNIIAILPTRLRHIRYANIIVTFQRPLLELLKRHLVPAVSR